jgi:gliding motility-associated-like protein
MDINENNSRLLESGDPIPGLDDVRIKYRVTAVNKVNNEIVSVSNTIEVKPSLYVYVPNAFTPNEDGLNDTFGGLGYGFKDYHLIIYNRWGQLVFETDKQSDQWDGTYGGKSAPIGSYAYAIEVKGYYENDFHKEGTISIIKV